MSSQLAKDIKSVIYRFDQISTDLEKSKNRLDFFSSQYFRDQFTIAAKDIGSDNALISVDIFDTLLLRDSTSEIKRFSLIAEEQCKYLNQIYGTNLTRQDLLAARLSGTKISYRASNIVNGCREGSINDIYKVAARALGLPHGAAQELVQLEIDHEKRVLTLNTGLLNLLREYKSKGVRCIMISDMYLHASHIKELVAALIPDYLDIFDEVYSSADSTVSKASQKIFPLIGEILNVSPEKWLHMGDAIKGDYSSPLAQKMKSIYLPIPLEIREERDICEKQFIAELSEIGLNPKKFNS